MNKQISFMFSFIVGLIFMLMPAMLTANIQRHLFDDFKVLFDVMVWLGFLSVIVFGLAILFEGIKNIVKILISLTDPRK